MIKTYSAASIYGIIDRMDDAAIHAWLNWHQRLKYPPRFINLFTAAKFDQGPNILRLVRTSLPDTTPIWRGYDGKDAWGNISGDWNDSNFYLMLWNASLMSPQMAAGMWFARRVKPFVDVIRETGAIVHLLNEAAPIFNAPFETECIRLLGEEGIRAGAFAWAAGTPDWPDYDTQPIQDEVKMAAKYDALVMVHEYAGNRPEEQNSLINRNQKLVSIYDQLQLKKPDVFLGEFALAKAQIVNGKIILDPDAGWGEMGVTIGDYAKFIVDTAKAWYVPNKVVFSLYCWPDWGRNGSFGLGDTPYLLDLLIGESESMTINVEDAVVTTPAPAPVEIMPRPAEAQSSIRARVKSIPTDYRNLRASWDFRASKTGELKPGDVARRFNIPVHNGKVSDDSWGNWIYVEKLSDETAAATVVAAGYVWSQRITWENINPTAEVPVVTPAPEPTPAPDPTPAPPAAPTVTAKRYSIEIEATDERHALIEKTLMALLTSVVYLGQAMSGVSVTINSEAVV